MMTDETQESPSPTARPGPHRLLPFASVAVAVVAVLAHLAGGAALLHFNLGGSLAYLGVDVEHLGGLALMAGLAAVITVKLLVVFGARRWWRRS